MKIHFLIFILISVLFGCSSSNSTEQETKESKYLKVIVFVDKTASITETGIPQISPPDFNGLIDLFEQNEGELIVTEIKTNSKINPRKFYFHQTKIPPKEFGQSYEEYEEEIYETIGDPKKNKEKNNISKKELKEYLDKICDYSKLYESTDILGAIEYGLKYLNEPISSKNKKILKAAFFITDGMDTMQKEVGNYSDSKKNNLIYLIRKSNVECVFNTFDPLEFTDYLNAISNFKQQVDGNH